MIAKCFCESPEGAREEGRRNIVDPDRSLGPKEERSEKKLPLLCMAIFQPIKLGWDACAWFLYGQITLHHAPPWGVLGLRYPF
jgi:hypothetical protein